MFFAFLYPTGNLLYNDEWTKCGITLFNSAEGVGWAVMFFFVLNDNGCKK